MAAYEHAPWMYWVGVAHRRHDRVLRLSRLFLAFTGEYRGHAHPHESPLVMWAPLAVLAALVARRRIHQHPELAGTDVPRRRGCRTRWQVSPVASASSELRSRIFYVAEPRPGRFVRQVDGRPLQAGLQQIFVDEIYAARRRSRWSTASRVVLWRGVDAGLIDGIVNGVGIALARHRRHSPAAAIRKYPQLRGLGRARLGGGADRYRVRGGHPMTLLDVVIFLPLAAFLIILALPKDNLH